VLPHPRTIDRCFDLGDAVVGRYLERALARSGVRPLRPGGTFSATRSTSAPAVCSARGADDWSVKSCGLSIVVPGSSARTTWRGDAFKSNNRRTAIPFFASRARAKTNRVMLVSSVHDKYLNIRRRARPHLRKHPDDTLRKLARFQNSCGYPNFEPPRPAISKLRSSPPQHFTRHAADASAQRSCVRSS
jgi:hypothetical protein